MTASPSPEQPLGPLPAAPARSLEPAFSETVRPEPSSSASDVYDTVQVIEYETTSGGSTLAVPWWVSPSRLLNKVALLWKSDKTKGVTSFVNPYAQNLFDLKVKAANLKDTSNADANGWYRLFLEDLIDDISKDLKNPEQVTKGVLKDHKAALSCLQKDYSASYSKFSPQHHWEQTLLDGLDDAAVRAVKTMDQNLKLESHAAEASDFSPPVIAGESFNMPRGMNHTLGLGSSGNYISISQ